MPCLVMVDCFVPPISCSSPGGSSRFVRAIYRKPTLSPPLSPFLSRYIVINALGYIGPVVVVVVSIVTQKHRSLLEAWGGGPFLSVPSELWISGFIDLQHRWLRGPTLRQGWCRFFACLVLAAVFGIYRLKLFFLIKINSSVPISKREGV